MLGHYTKDFDAWNERKQKVDTREVKKSVYFKEREIWWTSVGVNVGSEIDGKNDLFERPVLILTKLGNQQFYGIPITTKQKEGKFYQPITHGNMSGVLCLSQLKAFSAKRLLRKVGVVEVGDFERYQMTVTDILSGS